MICDARTRPQLTFKGARRFASPSGISEGVIWNFSGLIGEIANRLSALLFATV